ncbi:MAG: hypothetical protein E6R03_09235 [Hyphomicrobiaceae bacterium]|nr:MAG: hypothetical protein E6R03_09235 [Hyphomicrobiaceae bacterium]
MTIEVKNAEVIIKLVKEKLDEAKARLKGALDDEVTRMVRRTRSGKDVDGQDFAAYTEAYNKRKASLRSGFITRTGKKGKNSAQVKGVYSATKQPVDLTLSGNMLASIQTKVEDTPTGAVGTVFFNSAIEAAKAQGNQKKRRFFGFAEEAVQRIKLKLLGK